MVCSAPEYKGAHDLNIHDLNILLRFHIHSSHITSNTPSTSITKRGSWWWRTAACGLALLLVGCASFKEAVSVTTPQERMAYAQMALDTARFIYTEWQAGRGEAAAASAAEREAKLKQQQASIDFWTSQIQKLQPLLKPTEAATAPVAQPAEAAK